jgi:acetyltransferase EpsM
MYSRAVVGCSVLVDPDVTIGAECRIDDAAYISPGVHLGSSVHVGALSFVGLGAVVVPDTRIGRGSIVGAGAVVTRDVPDETLVVGNPALPKGKALMDNISPYPSRGRRPIDEH